MLPFSPTTFSLTFFLVNISGSHFLSSVSTRKFYFVLSHSIMFRCLSPKAAFFRGLGDGEDRRRTLFMPPHELNDFLQSELEQKIAWISLKWNNYCQLQSRPNWSIRIPWSSESCKMHRIYFIRNGKGILSFLVLGKEEFSNSK